MNIIPLFAGFDYPQENWSKLPHAFIEALPQVTSLAELKVILYVLRHTWGYREFDDAKTITADEFANGRKRKDGSRIDKGIGMGEPAIRSGLKNAIEHGFLNVNIDDTDKARIEKSYKLAMNTENVGVENRPSGLLKSTPGSMIIDPRSEKDTLDKKPKKDDANKSRRVSSALMTPMKDAIAAAFEWAAPTEGEWGKIQKAAKLLILADVQPSDIPSLYAYCKKHLTEFGPNALPNHVSEWRKENKPAQPAPAPAPESIPASPFKKFDAAFLAWQDEQNEVEAAS